eukprot:TRINITY_DN7000_c0_g1_i3.p1 TRINITY_DN7000_c0_g1~~TRINITY_DN7000_c0_g1_i3.p1  ORF type:complete len:307 (-),score=83.48 TRINITY_DN7000_c0_g1_i3:687-1607(-)
MLGYVLRTELDLLDSGWTAGAAGDWPRVGQQRGAAMVLALTASGRDLGGSGVCDILRAAIAQLSLIGGVACGHGELGLQVLFQKAEIGDYVGPDDVHDFSPARKEPLVEALVKELNMRSTEQELVLRAVQDMFPVLLQAEAHVAPEEVLRRLTEATLREISAVVLTLHQAVATASELLEATKTTEHWLLPQDQLLVALQGLTGQPTKQFRFDVHEEPLTAVYTALRSFWSPAELANEVKRRVGCVKQCLCLGGAFERLARLGEAGIEMVARVQPKLAASLRLKLGADAKREWMHRVLQMVAVRGVP